MNKFIYLKQSGIFSLSRFFYFKFLKKILKKNKIAFKTIYNTEYNIFNWDDQGSSLFIRKYFSEWGIEHFFLYTLNNRRKNIFLDIGCHSGYYVSLYTKFFKKIIGFEPSSKCQIALREIKKKYSNFYFYNYFMGKSEKKVFSKQYKNGFAYFEGSKTKNLFKNHKIKKIQLTYIDKFVLKNLKNEEISAIKIDVDGIDIDVLKGGLKTIKRYKPSIMIECEKDKINQLLLIMKDLNYQVYSFVTSVKKPYNLTLKKINMHDKVWATNLVCLNKKFIPKKMFLKQIEGSIFFGINWKKIMRKFPLKSKNY